MMLAQHKNRVQAIKSKFENLQVESEPLVVRKKQESHLYKQNESGPADGNINKENVSKNRCDSDSSEETVIPKPNSSYLYDKSEAKQNIHEIKKALSRQSSDPGKKLHRSHAFRCDRTVKLVSPKRHGSCKGRSETGDFSLKMGDKKITNERLKKINSFVGEQIKKEDIESSSMSKTVAMEEPVPFLSVPDQDVPQHILDQYAKVLKPKKNSEMTDSGVSSETENLEDDKSKKLELSLTNLTSMENEVCASTETMRLERKNPHVKLTDTLKKALKQPLPMGPPPKKPPRTFEMVETKKDAKKMLEKLEQVLLKREAKKCDKNIYDIAEADVSEPSELNLTTESLEKPKEIHYLCTEILDITQRTLLPNQMDSTDVLKNCFNSLNCTTVTNRSTTSLPYSRLSQSLTGENLNNCCSCSCDNLNERPRLSTFFKENICQKCKLNETKANNFKCHLNCKCKEHNSEFFVQKQENIYDVPFGGKISNKADDSAVKRKSEGSYGFVNSAIGMSRIVSKSLEDLKLHNEVQEEKIYDIPCDISRPATPDIIQSVTTETNQSEPSSKFEKLRQNFEKEERTENKMAAKPLLKPKPLLKMPSDSKIKMASTENLSQEFKTARQNIEKKFATESKKYRKNEKKDHSISTIAAKKERRDQLDLDRENLSRLMSEIYETVSAACEMDETRPTKFPTDGASSDESVKLTRSLTDKRKNYVRRVSSRAAYIDARKKNKFRHQTSVCSYKSDIIDNNYSTFRSWKSFRHSQQNLNKESKMAESKFNLTDSSGNLLSMRDEFDSNFDNLSVDDKTGCLDLELPFESEKKLFDVCLLVGLSIMTGQAYVKSVFPSEVKVPPHIENLVFPETISLDSTGSKIDYNMPAERNQSYSLVLTDEKGERRYGYCRRVLPEGASVCLPLCYCLIGRYRAPGFYYQVLKEIESHHGSSEVEINTILQQLFESDFPYPGEEISIKYDIQIHQELIKNNYRKSCNLGDILKSKTLPNRGSNVNSKVDDFGNKNDQNKKQKFSPEKQENGSKDVSSKNCDPSNNIAQLGNNNDHLSNNIARFGNKNDRIPDFYDVENNNRKTVIFIDSVKCKVIKRNLEPRINEDNLCILLDTLGAGLLIKVFGSLLLERKVVIVSDDLSRLSACMEGLQSILYPFVWQQPLISTIPSELRREILEAPLPILAGLLKKTDEAIDEGLMFEEGMLIDVTSTPKVVYFQGDESTILPTGAYKTLKTTLQMESNKNQNRTEDDKTRNVLISEAFLRFFVDALGNLWDSYSVGALTDSQMGKGDVIFNKETFVKNASSKQQQFFLEWFTETAMFTHFVQNMAACYKQRKEISPAPLNYSTIEGIVDAPLPNFYEIFEQRSSRKQNGQKFVENSKNNYKNALNKKVKLLKNKLRDLVT